MIPGSPQLSLFAKKNDGLTCKLRVEREAVLGCLPIQSLPLIKANLLLELYLASFLQIFVLQYYRPLKA
jgi:hypothetical protein